MPQTLDHVSERYPVRISGYYRSLIEDEGDPLWRQCMPDPAELDDAGQADDPLDEERLSPVPGLIHRYPDRVVLLACPDCAVHCRFCMRKRHRGHAPPAVDVAAACDYLRSQPAVSDVILSGGDPLMLDIDRLDAMLAALRAVPTVRIVRIGTRIPAVDPSRVTPHLCAMLKRHHPLFMNTHFNHPREVTAEAVEACARLADAGIPLGNQTVLLKGVNDSPAVIEELLRRLLAARVRPYYLHQMDLVRGTAHFRTPLSTGIAIMDHLRGRLSGIGIPSFMIDLPGGRGKVPVLPDYVRFADGRAEIRTPAGLWTEYPDAP